MLLPTIPVHVNQPDSNEAMISHRRNCHVLIKYWAIFINLLLFCTGRNVPWEVANMDDGREESCLKAVLKNTSALVILALALTEGFVTSVSLADMVDTGLLLRDSCFGVVVEVVVVL